MSEREVHTPNVPRLLFPASFARVGAQTVDPLTLLPGCGEALIAQVSKGFFQFATEKK
jgi:hypothetical protein